MFSAYRQSTKNSSSWPPWSTISFTLRYTVLHWLLKWFGPPHFKQDFPQAGHSFRACVVPHLLQLCLLPPFRAPRPRERDCLPPVEAWFVLRRLELSASTCCSCILAAPFILTKSLCASSEHREISTAFCGSSFGSRSSHSFSAGFSVENTILSLIVLSGSANSQGRESGRSWVRNSSNVWPEVFKRSQNWYLDNTIRFWPANLVSNVIFTWSYFSLSSPSCHLRWLYRSKLRRRVQLPTTIWRS